MCSTNTTRCSKWKWQQKYSMWLQTEISTSTHEWKVNGEIWAQNFQEISEDLKVSTVGQVGLRYGDCLASTGLWARMYWGLWGGGD